MQDFKTILDNTIKARSHSIDKLPKEAVAFIDAMLNSAITTHERDIKMAEYKVRCADTLIRYFINPSMNLWDKNSKLEQYLLTNQLP